MSARSFLLPLSVLSTLAAWAVLVPAAALAAAPEQAPGKGVGKGEGKSLPAASAAWRDCEQPACPWLVSVPAGRFQMGSPAKESERELNEGPQREVRVPAFAIGRTEVSFEQWEACVAAGGCPPQTRDERWGRGQRPVIHIRYEMAQRYVQWLSAKTGQRYRLPSEAEWEYAARAGTRTPFSFSEVFDTERVNVAGGFTYDGSKPGIDRQRSVPVGSLPANPWGLHEMHGNVQEWVQDCWHESYRGAPKDARPWTDNCDEPRQVLRGGNWYDRASFARSAFRGGLWAGSAAGTGLRVVRELTPADPPARRAPAR